MSRHEHVWLRRIGVLVPSCAKHTSVSASLSGLPYVSVEGSEDR